MTHRIKQHIDNMTHEQMLRKIKFAPADDRMFHGKIGRYFRQSLAKKESWI